MSRVDGSGSLVGRGRSAWSIAASLIGLAGGGLFTLAGCVLLLSPSVGAPVLAWAIPLFGSGLVAWGRSGLSHVLARVSLAASLAGIALLVTTSWTISDVDVDSTLGLLAFWSAVFLPLPLIQVLLTSMARR